MLVRRVFFITISFVLSVAAVIDAQDHQHGPAPAATPAADHQHEHSTTTTTTLFSVREGSGTGWLPLNSEMYALHSRAGRWELMWHGNAFLQFLHETANEHRGATQAGSVNWLMGMARRELGAARIGFRAMASIEPATVGGCGYPDLLATGELCDGDSIHDRQHPHDFFMELAGEYDRPISGAL